MKLVFFLSFYRAQKGLKSINYYLSLKLFFLKKMNFSKSLNFQKNFFVKKISLVECSITNVCDAERTNLHWIKREYV